MKMQRILTITLALALALTITAPARASEETDIPPAVEEPVDPAPMPDEEEAPDETPAPDEGETPDEDPVPDEEETPDEAPVPDEEETPDEDPAPDEEETPDEDPAPDDEEVPDDEEAPPAEDEETPEEELEEELEEILIDVVVPSSGRVVINPYRMKVAVSDGETTEQIVHEPQMIQNFSAVPVRVDARAVGTLAGVSDAEFVAAPPAWDESAKEIFMYLEFQPDYDQWTGAYYDADNQLLVTDFGESKEDVLTLDAFSAGYFRLSGAMTDSPDEMWTSDDAASVTIVFSFADASDPLEEAFLPEEETPEEEPLPPEEDEPLPPDEDGTVPPDEDETTPPDEDETLPPEDGDVQPPTGDGEPGDEPSEPVEPGSFDGMYAR